jgi:hypothetical protein
MYLIFAFAVVAAAPVEPAGIGRLVRGASPAVVSSALASPLLDACRPSMKSADIDNLPCRLAVVAALADAMQVTTAAELKVRQDLVSDVLAAASWASSYTPSVPAPGLRRTRLEAHKRACAIVFDAVVDLEAIAAGAPLKAAAEQVLAGHPPGGRLREQACACASRTASLALSADASPDEQAEIQGVLSAKRCFMDSERAIDVVRKGPEGFSLGSAVTRELTAAASPAGRLVAVAEGRQLELSRCTDKGVERGAIKDVDKLTKCACGVAKRWALPFKASDPRVEANLPLTTGVVLPVVVDGGAITTCGPAAAGTTTKKKTTTTTTPATP